MSNLNIIPNVAPGVGPMFQQLPPELILKIFKMILAAYNVPMCGNVIDRVAFSNIYGPHIQNVASVSSFFRALVFQVVFEANKYILPCTGPNRKLSRFRTTMPPAMPPVHFRHFLRRIKVELVIEDGYLVSQPGAHNGLMPGPAPTRTPITTATDLMRFCPGARSLASLTDALTGFSNLSDLELELIVDIRGSRQIALQVFQDAGFSVRARSVTVTINNRAGVSENWHRFLDRAIARV